MQRILSLFAMSMLMSVAWAQSYSYRYWLDNNEATAVTGSATGQTQFELDLGAMTPGIHSLHVQARGADGELSSVRSRYFMNTTQQTATTARYWLDNDLSTMHENVATSGSIDIDASRLTVGVHTIHYQTFSATGVPSAVRSRYLYIDKVHRDILKATVSIDGGEATTYALVDGDIVIDISELEDGEHTLNVVLTDTQGVLQGTNESVFTVSNRQTGDVNGDGSVDIGDIVMVISVMTQAETEASIVAAADVNGDGSADIGDIVAIIDIMASQPATSRRLSIATEDLLME